MVKNFSNQKINQNSKYFFLYEFLINSNRSEITLKLSEIEKKIKSSLPKSAYEQKSWWSNRRDGIPQSVSWMNSGFLVKSIDLTNEEITFVRPLENLNPQKIKNSTAWNGKLIKALRIHTGTNQSELAEKLGVRQQTISDWETGVYKPRLSFCKYLDLFSEKVGFDYFLE